MFLMPMMTTMTETMSTITPTMATMPPMTMPVMEPRPTMVPLATMVWAVMGCRS
jgi:hypothetical protein